MNTAERWFAQQFIVRNKRERVLYELERADKRRTCLWNMTTAGNDRLKADYVHDVTGSCDELLQELRESGISWKSPVSIISGHPELDGQTLPLKEALRQVWHHWPYVLITSEHKIALLAGESGNNAPWRAMLK